MIKLKTQGFLVVNSSNIASRSKLNPCLMLQNLKKKIHLVICEKELLVFKRFKLYIQKYELIILDDNFQHSDPKAGFNIFITDFSKPFIRMNQKEKLYIKTFKI